jgi:hypothetical protein
MEKRPLHISIKQHAINLILPLTLFVFLAIFYLFVVPSGESPDESGHVQCIEQVAQDGKLPIIDPEPLGNHYWSRSYALSGFICYHMPLYYLVVGYAQIAAQSILSFPVHYEFPPTNLDGPKPNMFLHEEKDGLFFLEEPATMILTRIISILLWGGMCIATYGIVLKLAPHQPHFATIATTLLAGWPQFLFMSRAINNDALAIPLTAVTLWLLLDTNNPRRLPWASLFASAALLTKLTTLFIFILLIIYLPFEIWQSKDKRSTYKKPTLLTLLILGSTILLIFLHPLLSKHAQITLSLTNGISENASKWSYWQDVWRLTLSSGWVRFGMMNVPAPQWQANLWWFFIAAAGLIGIGWYLKHNQANTQRKQQLIIILLWSGAIVASYLRININRYQPQFRYLFFLLPLIVSFAGIGLAQSTQRFRHWPWATLISLAAFLAAINIWIILKIVLPAYGI